MSKNEQWTRIGTELQSWLWQQYRAVPEKSPGIPILGSL